MGLATTTAVLVLLAIDQATAAWALLGVLIVFASLEAFVGFCTGCFLYAQLAKTGLVAECEDCADITLRVEG
jgi:hypothetical protein